MSASRQGKEALAVVHVADRLVELTEKDIAKFWARVGPADPVTGCWPWQGMIDNRQYGAISYGPREARNVFPAHRLAYQLVFGPVPKGLELDHACHTSDSTCPAGNACLHRRCVNPWHLETVTHSENMARLGWRLTHCKRGHSLADAHINRTTGRRQCRTCRRLSYPTPKGRTVQPCGTRGAYRRHRAAGEQPCAPCVQANFEYENARWQRRKAAA